MILEATKDAIDHCVSLLQQDEIVAVPTETVYGLAGNALKESSVRKIFQVKGRPLIDPLIVHCKNLQTVEGLAAIDDNVRKLAKNFWPGPLTVVVPKNEKVPDIVTAGLPSVAVRVSKHPVLQTILEHLDFPLAAPSANPFGYVSPTLASHVKQTLGSKLKAILDGGPCNIGLESTILDMRLPEKPVLLRQGAITAEQIEQCLGNQIKTKFSNQNEDHQAQNAPGQLTKHYSPKTVVSLLEHGSFQVQDFVIHASDSATALICNRKPDGYTASQANIYWLSETGNLEEIARNLFDLMQVLDQQGFQKIYIEKASAEGLGLAINERLRRASA